MYYTCPEVVTYNHRPARLYEMSRTPYQGVSLYPAEDAVIRILAMESPLATRQPQFPMPCEGPYATIQIYKFLHNKFCPWASIQHQNTGGGIWWQERTQIFCSEWVAKKSSTLSTFLDVETEIHKNSPALEQPDLISGLTLLWARDWTKDLLMSSHLNFHIVLW